MKATLASLVLLIVLGGPAMAQEPAPPMPSPDQGPPAGSRMTPPPEGGPQGELPGGERPWWKDPQARQKLQLSDQQSQKIEKIDRDNQIQDIDLRASVEKESARLHTLMESDTPARAQVLAQVDELSQARAQLEKSHMEMLLAVRQVLTAEQAKKLRNFRGGPGDRPGPDSGPPEGGPPEGAPPPPPQGQ